MKRSRRGSSKASLSRFCSKLGGGLVIGDEAAAIYVAVAGAVLQRNAPLPTGLVRDRLRVWPEMFGASGRRCKRWIARKVIGPVAERNTERLASRITERKPVQSQNMPSTLRPPSSSSASTSPISVLRSTVSILPSMRMTPPRFGVPPQTGREQGRIEMIGVD